MSADQSYVAGSRDFVTGFTVTTGTQAKILVPETPSGVAYGTLTTTGGCRVVAGTIASTDAVAKSALIWVGDRLSAMGNATGTITSQNVITRNDAGSFLTDGWSIGDPVMAFGTGLAADDGVQAVLTAVTALVLTFNGTPFTNTTLAATTKLYRMAQRTQRAIPANSGNADATLPVPLFTTGATSQDPDLPALPDTGLSLGPTNILAVSFKAALSALPAQIFAHAAAELR